MKYLITGGCGFIGSHIAEKLVSEGHSVRVFDNLSSGHEKNIASFREKVEFIKADVREPEALKKAASGVDGVFHEAALVSVFDSVERPADNNAINITGTLNVLMAARDAKVRRVVVASSAAIYGEDPTMPKTEDMLPRPVSPYGVAKLVKEHYMSIFAGLYGVQTVSLRYFNVYGPRQDPKSMYSGVISKFTDVILAGQNPTVFGDGQQTRDFVFVRDVVQANLLAMRSDKVGHGEAINVGTAKRISLLDLLAAMKDITGRKFEVGFKPARTGDIKHSLADISKAVKLLGYKPQYGIREGLKELLDYTAASAA